MDEQTPKEGRGLTPEEVGARVGAILGDAEREAREIIASARREQGGAPAPATLDDLAHGLERLGARFDAFELATAAQIEELGRQLREALAGSAPPAAASEEQLHTPAPRPPRVESAAYSAARVRAIDLALAGYPREVIANELASSLDRTEVEQLLDEVLIG
jgi:hypothetical protein